MARSRPDTSSADLVSATRETFSAPSKSCSLRPIPQSAVGHIPADMTVAATAPSQSLQEELVVVSDSVSQPRKTRVAAAYPSPPTSPRPNRAEVRKHQEASKYRSGSPKCASVKPSSPELKVPSATGPSPGVANSKDANQGHANPPDLRTRLGLGGWRCGAIKADGMPCRMPLRGEKTQSLITSQIESLVSLTRSAPTFIAELGKLVTLVHCRFHNYGEVNDARIEAWESVFVASDDGAESAVPVGKQIRKVLGRVSTFCLGITKGEERCQNRIGGQKVQNCARTIDEIVKPESYSDDEYLEGLLEVLAANMYCHIHKRSRNGSEVTSWKSAIIDIRDRSDCAAIYTAKDKATKEDQSLEHQNTRSALLTAPPTPPQEPRTPRNSRSSSPRFDDPSAYWPKEYDISPFKILNKSEEYQDYKSSYDLVQKEIRRPLDWNEKFKGYVYVYEVEGNEGFVKIGYTSRSVNLRHEEWEFDCNRQSKILYPIATESVMEIPNARRVESLCHAELAHRRITIHCSGCLKQHIEWFEVSPEEAISVIWKWSKWMATSPYEAGFLREEENRRLGDISTFMTEISATIGKSPRGGESKAVHSVES